MPAVTRSLAAVPGYGGKLKVTNNAGQTLELGVKTWSVEPKAATSDITSTLSGGYQELLGSIRSATVNFEASLDTAKLPHGTSVGLDPGSDAVLHLITDGAREATVPGLVTATPLSLDVTKELTYSCTLESSGQFSLPTS